MALIVQKYGGSSVRSTKEIRHVARRIVAAHDDGHDVVVVVSAMGDTTDQLLRLARELSPLPSRRELDMLLTAGERISNALAAIAVHTLGAPACSLTGPQAGVITTSAHGRAQIVDVEPKRVRQALDRGEIVLVAGFQGVSRETDEVTTLGRGGSDTTAIALAAALKADVCEIRTDVDAVYTADPKLVPEARPLHRLSYEAMRELADSGAKVLAPRSVEYARRHGVTIHVRSARADGPGTVVSGDAASPRPTSEAITGVAHDLSCTRLTMTAVPDHPEALARVFRGLADAETEVDLAVHHLVPSPDGRRGDITLVLPRGAAPAALAVLRERRVEVGYRELAARDDIGTVSVVGSRMRAATIAAFSQALAVARIRCEAVSTSGDRITALCPGSRVPDAVRTLHRTFGLGTGRETTDGLSPLSANGTIMAR